MLDRRKRLPDHSDQRATSPWDIQHGTAFPYCGRPMVVVGHSKTSTTLPNSATRMAAWHMFVNTISTMVRRGSVRTDPGTHIVAVCLGTGRQGKGRAQVKPGGDSSKVPRTSVRAFAYW